MTQILLVRLVLRIQQLQTENIQMRVQLVACLKVILGISISHLSPLEPTWHLWKLLGAAMPQDACWQERLWIMIEEAEKKGEDQVCVLLSSERCRSYQ